MSIKTVNDIKQTSERWTLLRQIRLRATTQYQHVYVVFIVGNIVHRIHGHAVVNQGDGGRIAAAEYTNQLHIWALLNGGLGAAAKVAVTGDGDSNY